MRRRCGGLNEGVLGIGVLIEGGGGKGAGGGDIAVGGIGGLAVDGQDITVAIDDDDGLAGFGDGGGLGDDLLDLGDGEHIIGRGQKDTRFERFHQRLRHPN